MVSAIERIERAAGPESAARVERLFNRLADRIEELAEERGSADLELHARVHHGKVIEGRFDPDERVV